MDTLTIIEGFDVAGNSRTGVSACRKGEPVNALGFQRAEERFRQGVIPTLTGQWDIGAPLRGPVNACDLLIEALDHGVEEPRD